MKIMNVLLHQYFTSTSVIIYFFFQWGPINVVLVPTDFVWTRTAKTFFKTSSFVFNGMVLLGELRQLRTVLIFTRKV